MSNECCHGTNRGVYCIATNCVHHTSENACTAEQIKVDNKTATSSTETCCATFSLKSE